MSASSQTCQDDISFSDILSKGVGVGGGGGGGGGPMIHLIARGIAQDLVRKSMIKRCAFNQ